MSTVPTTELAKTSTVRIQRETSDTVRITVRNDGERFVFTVPTEPLVCITQRAD